MPDLPDPSIDPRTTAHLPDDAAGRIREAGGAGASPAGSSSAPAGPGERPGGGALESRLPGAGGTGEAPDGGRAVGIHVAGEGRLAELPALVHRLIGLAEQRMTSDPVSPDARERARRLRDHLTGHVLPRARSLEAPLLVLLLGPTGAGKSSLMNTLAGRPVSAAGVLRPTTRRLVMLVRPADARSLLGPDGALASIEPDRRTVVEESSALEGVALVDAPDVDSIEHANRALTDRLVEAADLAVFVTTATRYADRVPWDVLRRVRERGLPLVVVVNRLPADQREAQVVLTDVARLIRDAGLEPLGMGGASGSLDVLGVREGDLDPSIDGLDPRAIQALRARLDALGRDRQARRALAARALEGSLAGLADLIERIADDADHEAIDADALRRTARHAYDAELAALHDDLSRGTFLRAEALRQWNEFVGADQITRFFATGLERIRGTLAALVQGTPEAPIAQVGGETVADLAAVARAHATVAARRTATAWNGEPRARGLIADRPDLWQASSDFGDRLVPRLEQWMRSIADDVRSSGASKRRVARGASIGVNAAGVGVMLATFAQTGGITGAEVGLAAATAFLNQRLLEALFGDAALLEMVGRARRGLGEVLATTTEEELGRYLALVPDGEGLRDLAAQLREAASDVGSLGEHPLETEATTTTHPGTPT